MMPAANFMLALIWMALTETFTLLNLLVGFILGYVVLALICGLREPGYVRQVWSGLSLLAYTAVELVHANLRVAWYTIANLRDLKPAILRVPLRHDLTDGELTLLSTLITLTPGTLTIDVAEDRSALFVHFMHVEDVDESIASIQEGFEQRIVEMTR